MARDEEDDNKNYESSKAGDGDAEADPPSMVMTTHKKKRLSSSMNHGSFKASYNRAGSLFRNSSPVKHDNETDRRRGFRNPRCWVAVAAKVEVSWYLFHCLTGCIMKKSPFPGRCVSLLIAGYAGMTKREERQ